MLALLAALALLAPAPTSSGSGELLAFVHAFRGPGIRTATIGHSMEGRRIELRQLGAPRWPGELLVFAASMGTSARPAQSSPCPAP